MLTNTGIRIPNGLTVGNQLLYDDVNRKYWDGSLVGGSAGSVTYNDTLNYIAELNNNCHSTEWCPWRLATVRDVKSLLNKNPLVVITSLFFRTEDTGTVYVWEGRYDKITAPGSHGEFIIRWTHIDQTVPGGNPSFDFSTEFASIGDNELSGTYKAGRLGAWIVADAV
jgi:hypothetical protein